MERKGWGGDKGNPMSESILHSREQPRTGAGIGKACDEPGARGLEGADRGSDTAQARNLGGLARPRNGVVVGAGRLAPDEAVEHLRGLFVGVWYRTSSQMRLGLKPLVPPKLNNRIHIDHIEEKS